VRKAINKAREQVAEFIDAQPDRIIFTSCGTEANNLAIQSMASKHHNIATSSIEHPAVMNPCRALSGKGHTLELCGVDPQGFLRLDQYRQILSSSNQGFSSIMWANNETGAIQPIETIEKLTHEAGWLLHTDAIQAVGKIPLSVADIPVDSLSISAHKFHGPKGIGALYFRDREDLDPLILGGGQENGSRSGTEHVAGIIGMGMAAEMARDALLYNKQEKSEAKRNEFLARLQNEISGIQLHSPMNSCLWNVINFSAAGCHSAALRILLDDSGLICSAGSACMTGKNNGSHVLAAMGVSKEEAAGAIRLSLSLLTTSTELHTAVSIIKKVVSQIRSEQ
jgi:cysteine desulfurase